MVTEKHHSVENEFRFLNVIWSSRHENIGSILGGNCLTEYVKFKPMKVAITVCKDRGYPKNTGDGVRKITYLYIKMIVQFFKKFPAETYFISRFPL